MSAFTRTDLANLALRHIGQSEVLTDLDTDGTAAAEACLAFIDVVIAELFREFDWPCGTVIADLTLVETDPNDDWGYSYRYLATADRMTRIPSGARQDTSASRIPYKIVKDDAFTVSAITKANPAVITTGTTAHNYTAGDVVYISDIGGMIEITDGLYTVGTVPTTTTFQLKSEANANVNSTGYTTFTSGGSIQNTDLILTDQADAQAEYQIIVTNPQLWDRKLRMAASYRLALMIAPTLSRDPSITSQVAQLYERSMGAAEIAVLNEEHRDPPPDAETISGRG